MAGYISVKTNYFEVFAFLGYHLENIQYQNLTTQTEINNNCSPMPRLSETASCELHKKTLVLTDGFLMTHKIRDASRFIPATGKV